MARPNSRLIFALRETARRLDGDQVRYAWGHMGACNCGHLAQTVTRLSRAEIHARAMERAGDWGEQVVEYCPTSGYAIDHVIGELLDLGLTRGDLADLERLSGSRVLARLPVERRALARNSRTDVVLYLETWADALEEELPPAPHRRRQRSSAVATAPSAKRSLSMARS